MGLYEFEENTENVENTNVFDSEKSEKIRDEGHESSEAPEAVMCGKETYSSEERLDGDAPAIEDDLKEIKKKKRRKKKTVAVVKEVISFVAIILAAFVAAILINIYVIRTSNISGTSMYPTLQNGQSVLISRVPYMFSGPERGDIIVFDATKEERTFFRDVEEALHDNAITKLFTKNEPYADKEEFYIKRVIGVAGDVLTVKDGVMYLNNEPLKNDGYSVNDDGTAYYAYEGMSWTVEEGYVFVMGDNRINSKDSRIMGLIPTDCIMGKVVKK